MELPPPPVPIRETEEEFVKAECPRWCPDRVRSRPPRPNPWNLSETVEVTVWWDPDPPEFPLPDPVEPDPESPEDRLPRRSCDFC